VAEKPKVERVEVKTGCPPPGRKPDDLADTARDERGPIRKGTPWINVRVCDCNALTLPLEESLMTYASFSCAAVLPLLTDERQARGGHPLDASTLTVMESRFGQDFSQVRVYTDTRAAAVADAVQARAFTAGNDIVFAAGQYAPETAQGKWLLAHELTHVVQQRLGKPAGPLYREVGVTDDPLEIEAEHVADRLVKGGPLPEISADHTGLIRRVVRIVPGSARFFNFHHNNDTRIVQTNANSRFDFFSDTAAGNDAVSYRGQVTFSGDPGDTLTGWTVGFIQVKWITTNWMYYRGQTNADGSLLLQFARPPARLVQGCRDTTSRGTAAQIWDALSPLAQPTDVFTAAGQRITASTGVDLDSPHTFSPMVETNITTGQPNYLREGQLESHFCTVLSVQDPAGNFHHLVSFYWNVHWQARFQPRDFTDLTRPWFVTSVGGSFANGVHLSHFIQGTPTDPRIAPLLTTPITRVFPGIGSLNDGTNCNNLLDLADTNVIRRESRVWANFDVRI
jgi:hypothetical protein